MRGGVVSVRPVLFACAGCPEHGYLAQDAAAELDRRNLAEVAPLSSDGLVKGRARFPIYALEGCERSCAKQWLAGYGVTVQRCDFVGGRSALEIVAEW